MLRAPDMDLAWDIAYSSHFHEQSPEPLARLVPTRLTRRRIKRGWLDEASATSRETSEMAREQHRRFGTSAQ